jgi:hypothetical protein
MLRRKPHKRKTASPFLQAGGWQRGGKGRARGLVFSGFVQVFAENAFCTTN